MVENEQDAHDSHDDHDHGGVGKYYVVFGALCVLTFLSYIIGNYMHDTMAIACMMAVSCAKAMLVILFFMHLKYEANWKYVLTVPASIMSLFLLLMLVPDVGNRTNKYSQSRWDFAASPREAHAGTHGDDPDQQSGKHNDKPDHDDRGKHAG